jgi:hypothetical protein
MSRNRTISPDFWTWEAVIDCAPMTRLLFLGLWTFADDFGVQPLRPRTIRLQVFPGDALDCEAVRAMIEELAARGLVRRYSVDGQDTIAIVGWDRLQRVGKRARRRFPDISEADQRPTRFPPAAGTIANHSNPPTANHSNWPPASRVEVIANHNNPPSATRAEDIANHNNPPSTCVEEDWQALGTMRAPPPAAARAVLP